MGKVKTYTPGASKPKKGIIIGGYPSSPKKGTTTVPTTGENGNRPTEPQADIRSKFKEKAVRTWNLQPASGEIPDIGFRPKSDYWATEARKNRMGMYQFFMSQTLYSFYRGKTPDWAKKAWDIRLEINGGGTPEEIKEVEYYIIAAIDPQL